MPKRSSCRSSDAQAVRKGSPGLSNAQPLVSIATQRCAATGVAQRMTQGSFAICSEVVQEAPFRSSCSSASRRGVRHAHHVLARDPELLERGEGQRDRHVAVQDAMADIGEVGLPLRPRHTFPSRSPAGRPESSGTAVVISHPRRVRTRSPSSVETSARKPSHFTSKDHPEPEGSGPGRDGTGSGSRRFPRFVRR
jgi:hypothetical protein